MRYKWKDAQGGLHYTDTLPAEALQNGYDVVDAHGYVVRHVERARTEEERKADAATAATRAAERRHEQEQVQADQQLLNAYPRERTCKLCKNRNSTQSTRRSRTCN